MGWGVSVQSVIDQKQGVLQLTSLTGCNTPFELKSYLSARPSWKACPTFSPRTR